MLSAEDIERLKKTWWGLEGYMRDEGARKLEPDIVAIADEGFTLMRRGADVVDLSSGVPFWGAVMSLAFAQLYNTALATWELAYAGLYVQSRMLMRLLTEYLAVVWYLPNHPDDAEKWFQAGEIPQAGDLLAKVFADDSTTGSHFKNFRQLLNRFSHVDPTGFDILVDTDDEEREADPSRMVRNVPINIGGRFDQRAFQDTARLLLPLHGSVPAVMAKWKAGTDADWEDDVELWVQRVANIVAEYDRVRAAEESES